jgi:diacylglycerol kinase (ATP)
MSQQDLLVVVNAAAGSARRSEVHTAMAALGSAAAGSGARVEMVATADLQELTDTLGALDGRRLVVLGGDGSVHAAVQGLHDSGRLRSAGPIGVVPLGTGNDLARFLGIPGDPAAAAEVVMTGTAADMELLVADDGQIAINAVHVGIGAVAAARSARAKRRLGALRLGTLAYRAGAVVAGVSAKGWRLEVRVDGQVLHDGQEPVLMVAMGLGGTVGGGTPLVPAADPHDGLVDVVVSTGMSPLARLGYAMELKDGLHVRRADVRTARGRVVELQAGSDETFPGNADGEFRGPFARRCWQVEPQAWQVVLPDGAGRSRGGR